MNEPTLKEFRTALAVADAGSFRAAAHRLDAAPSTLSHAVAGLEEKLGRRLFNRSTRSIAVTPEGAAILARIASLIAEFDAALASGGQAEGSVAGNLRINAPLSAASFLLSDILPAFHAQHPQIEIDLRHEERMVDIVAAGCDAGIRLGRTVPPDMVGVPFGPSLRFLPVASPAYLADRGTPEHPRDLLDHRCIRTRMPRGERYSWQFAKNDEQLEIDVPGFLTLDRMALMIDAAVDGMGIAYVMENAAKRQILDGRLVPLLSDWCPADERYLLYFPGRRHVPAPLRAFIDFVKATVNHD
ncbi:LysR family transcriptional regulator [Salinisphaera sp. Q1T1-3]|uniref:LysR family transcriptional regulator n=1 Tax=Salinisphaera sp. Q1T1-3 TaxID=2321229 RepID=UPI000E709F42|nr:LysR family transcriptional regulator [Salinisphaera sp. Q1T1-3]RJS91000.1 LysR family transcriptional regulator [Salinisphaera sp. Q1T1-3]